MQQMNTILKAHFSIKNKLQSAAFIFIKLIWIIKFQLIILYNFYKINNIKSKKPWIEDFYHPVRIYDILDDDFLFFHKFYFKSFKV